MPDTAPPEIRALPWPAEQYPANGNAADEVTIDTPLRGLYRRTDAVRNFLSGLEVRLLTKYFKPISDLIPYSAATLAQLAAEARATQDALAGSPRTLMHGTRAQRLALVLTATTFFVEDDTRHTYVFQPLAGHWFDPFGNDPDYVNPNPPPPPTDPTDF